MRIWMLLGPRPGQSRPQIGRVREGRYARPGLRPLNRHHAIWPRRPRLVLLPGRGWENCWFT
jgi:hypothetical protein